MTYKLKSLPNKCDKLYNSFFVECIITWKKFPQRNILGIIPWKKSVVFKINFLCMVDVLTTKRAFTEYLQIMSIFTFAQKYRLF